MGNPIITADSKPDYDDWGWDTHWDCEDWITWHKELSKKYGNPKANQIWWDAWKFGDSGVIASVPLDCRSFNSNFKRYFASVGLLDAVLDASPLALAHITSLAGSAPKAVTKVVSNVGETIGNASGILKYLPYIILALALVVAGVFIYKNSSKLKLS